MKWDSQTDRATKLAYCFEFDTPFTYILEILNEWEIMRESFCFAIILEKVKSKKYENDEENNSWVILARYLNTHNFINWAIFMLF